MTDQAPTYDELSLRIVPAGEGRYRTVALGPDGAGASGTFELPFTETELDNFVLRVGRQRMGARAYRSEHMEQAKQFGTQLFDALMTQEVRDVFHAARGAAESRRKGLRVTLYLTEAPELMDVPWEFLYERPRFLAQSIYSPVVRSLDLGEARLPHPVSLPLNVLGMVSRPQGLGVLDVEREKEKLRQALAPLCERGLVDLQWLPRGTLAQLDQAIGRGTELHVFHYIGHGAYDSRTQGGILVLENDRGEPHEVSGEELGSLLQDERSLRLAVLNSCEGARSSHVDPFSGVASSLMQYGIPAVVGMQFEITDEAAIAFSARLYASLAEGYPVDAALAQSRRSIFAAGNDIEFGTPVLFLRGTDAHLFDLANPASAELGAQIESEALSGRQGHEDLPLEEEEVLPEGEVPWEEGFEAPVGVPQPGLVLRPREYLGWLLGGAAFRMLQRLAYRRRLTGKRRRVSNLRLALISGAVLLTGAIIAAATGEENSAGTMESPLGTAIAALGMFGLTFVIFRMGYDRLLRLIDRYFN
jgi:CHAT domain